MTKGTSQTSNPSSASASTSGRPFWLRELFNDSTIAAFNRVRSAINSGYAAFTAAPPASLSTDINTIYRAITLNEETITRLAQKQEDLKLESRLELGMKETLELEVKRLEESLAIHRREIKNIGIRQEIRQHELGDFKDLGLVILVQALREETPEEQITEKMNDDESRKEWRNENQS